MIEKLYYHSDDNWTGTLMMPTFEFFVIVGAFY